MVSYIYEVSLLRSDFRFVARLLTGEKSGKGFQFTDEPIAHVDATLKFLYAVTGDETFEEVRTSAKNRGEEPIQKYDYTEGR